MNDIEMSKTFRLFSLPSFWSGAASLLDFSGELNRLTYSETDMEADLDSLKDDWEEVAKDMDASIKKVKRGKKK